jgi:hypothetical protein
MAIEVNRLYQIGANASALDNPSLTELLRGEGFYLQGFNFGSRGSAIPPSPHVLNPNLESRITKQIRIIKFQNDTRLRGG